MGHDRVGVGLGRTDADAGRGGRISDRADHVSGRRRSTPGGPIRSWGDWLTELAGSPLAADPASDTGATIRHLKRDYDKRVKLPQSLVEELARTASIGQHVWQDARAGRFWFVPRGAGQDVRAEAAQAEALGYTDSPYDALLDDYEPGELTADVARGAGRPARCLGAAGGGDRRQRPLARRDDFDAAFSGGGAAAVRQHGGGEDRLRFWPRAVGRDGPSVLHVARSARLPDHYPL